MIDLTNFLNAAQNTFPGDYGKQLYEAGITKYKNDNHGDFATWLSTLEKIKSLDIEPFLDASSSSVLAGKLSCPKKIEQLTSYLRTFMPWRKGPFTLGSIFIDAEWRDSFRGDYIFFCRLLCLRP